MRPAQAILLVFLALLGAACGGGPSFDAPLAVAVDGVHAAYTPEYLLQPTLAAETRAVAETAAQAWGGSRGATDGWEVVFAQAPFACGAVGVDHAVGCTDPAAREIRILAFGAACPAATALPHELGHVVLGDSAHRDRRWCDREFWRAMRDALAAATEGCDLSSFVRRNLERCDDDGERDD